MRSDLKDDDAKKAKFVKSKVLNDRWWDKIDHILLFTEPIYDMLSFADTDKPSLHLVDMWDTMIEKVKSVIYWHEEKRMMRNLFFIMWCKKSWLIGGIRAIHHFIT